MPASSHWENVETSLPPPDGRAVPARPEELDASWLTACLRHAGVLPEPAQVAGFESIRIGEGHGFAGQLVRITPRYDPPQPAAPATLIGKFATEHAPTREMLDAVDGYVREVRFYRELAPRIGVGAPRCYFGHYDRAQGRFCLLLEDLAPARSVDPAVGLTVEQAEQVLDQLAALHARWWGRADELPWLALSEQTVLRVRERFLAALPSFEAQFRERYPVLARVASQLGELMSGDELLGKLREPPLTLAHNDLHLDNLFLPGEGGGRFALIDWQSLSFSRHGTTDVARVLCVGMQPALRRRHQRALLRHYHARLRQRGVRGYGLWRLRRRFREEITATVIIGVLALDTLDIGADQQAGVALIFGERLDAALRDARVGRLLAAMLFTIRLRRWARRLLGGAGALGPGA